MVVFSRIRLRVSSLWAFLIQNILSFLIHHGGFFTNNSIYKKATSFFSKKAKITGGCVYLKGAWVDENLNVWRSSHRKNTKKSGCYYLNGDAVQKPPLLNKHEQSKKYVTN